MAVVLVTGVNSGFGAAIRREFLDRGDTVIGTHRHPPEPNVETLDVTDAIQRKTVVNQIIEDHGRIDILINNAGTMVSGAVEDTPLDVMRAVFETNYFGAVGLIQEVLPYMRRQGFGRIVNVTAIGAILCTPFLATYGATKHALDGLSVALDEEVRGFGVRVTTVLPGAFKTEIMAKSAPLADSAAYADAAKEYRMGLRARLEASGPDLGPVASLVAEAATATEPLARYLIASEVMMRMLQPVVDSMELLRGPVTQTQGGKPQR